MHGREGEQRIHRRHMWSVPAPTTSSVAATHSAAITPDSFTKDGREIRVGDCALFKPPQDSPPFIGIIRRLILSKEDSLSVRVNWLYRPADVKLGKGTLLEAAPNEVFYSFHKDEIPAASVLHPCKVAFLRKGVELPSGISAFVCRRVYDIENKCLWWLTDQDYINSCLWTQERQEEVDNLLDKTRIEMYGAVQSGGRSPKPLNVPTGTPQLKPGSDSVQNNTSSFASQVKGKKRDRSDQGSDPVKRERLSKIDDADSGQSRPEHMMKSEIAKITDKGGLVDFEGVERLVQLMQPNNTEKKIDLPCRIMLVDVISVTDRFDCLVRFVQLRGLPVLDEWLQEVHKGKIGDGNGQKESDKYVEEFLLALLRALDKLPVNLHALQTCNVGKSVNYLRSHKNSEIQKKARGLVDTWKKRVEAEMNIIESKSGSGRGGSWPTKSVLSEVSHVVGRRNGGSSEVGIKSTIVQSSTGKTPQVKLGSGEAVSKFASTSPGTAKSAVSVVATSGAASSKDMNSAILGGGGTSDLPLSTIKEEKSSSSSQSQNNSQSCSSDQPKTGGFSCREDARSSTAASVSVNMISSSASRQRKSSNGLHGSSVSGVQKETGLGKFSSLNRNLTPEKESPTRGTHERVLDMPLVDHGNNQRLIVRLPNNGRSPARTASGGFEDPAVTTCKASPPHSEKLDHHDRKVKGKSEAVRAGGASYINMDICQGKDGEAGSDEGNVSATGALCDEWIRAAEDGEKLTEASKITGPSSRTVPMPGKSYEASFSSINALIESCVKFSEASTSASVGDDIGMNLLASVAAGEMPRSDVSPLGSPGKNSPVPEDSCSGDDVKSRHLEEDIARSKDQPSNGAISGAMSEQVNSAITLRIKNDSQHHATPVSTDFPGDGKGTSSGYEEKTGECCALRNDSSMDLKQHECGPSLTSNGKLGEPTHDASVAVSSVDITKEGNGEGEGSNQFHEQRKSGTVQVRSNSGSNSKVKAQSPVFDEDKKINYADEKAVENSAVMDPEASTSAKVENGANEESPSCSSSEISGDVKNAVHKGSDGGILTDKMPAPVANIHLESIGGKNEGVAVAPSSASFNALGMDIKAEKADEMQGGGHTVQNEKQKNDLGSPIFDHNNECDEKKSEKKEVIGDCPGKSATRDVSPRIAVQETEECMKSSECKLDGVKADGIEEPASSMDASLLPASGSDMAVKLDFDLNEGFPVDDGSQGDLAKSSVPGNRSTIHLPCPRSFPASITVASAAKGSFFPPENPSRSKGELGWKGSAATSAFRPAEPRKVLEMALSTTDIPLVDHTTSKHRRPPLDIDLNVPDQRVLDDGAPQNSAPGTCSESGPHSRSGGGGLDLDLNRVDESPEIGQFSVSNSCRIEIPQLLGRSSLSGGFSNGESNGSRDFDLNNGPGPEEAGTETTPHAKSSMQFLSPAPGVRMNSAELGNFSSWFPAIPSILPGRGEQSYPIVPSTGSQRILGPSTGGTFGPEIYRGPVLSSSPAVGFSPATSFQYPGFPFETNFPLSSNSYSGCPTAYVDSSSGGPLCFSGIPSQLVGPTGVVSSHYPRPLVMNLPGVACNIGPDTRKWGGQSLDLNAGPGGTDVERRDDRLPSALRQFPVGGSQSLADEQLKIYQIAGGMKRKEPDGGWDGERLSNKRPPWQ
ncbi:hypothetical protein F0562_004978 [Nyssa sinensis]|uniref:BAH domain-containing protein n=1 Tax=Nyssa sinensis TaxID=561372 RepID=A0A5J5AJA5_9ASTE|nr:hypothetical protein F0562_004978 [Nyssa sinensis]